MPYRILAIDGGGVRGIVPAIVLERLAAEPQLAGFLDRVDLLAGTSTGGLLALALAAGLPPTRIRALYAERASAIFDDSWLDDLVDLGQLRGAQYDLDPLRRELTAVFGDATLGDLERRVLITAFDLDNEDLAQRTWKPKLFHNFPGEGSDRGARVVDVALATSAAPTYFPSSQGYIDGGVYASNPAMCALAQTQDRRYAPTPPLDEVVLLSLGTGTTLQYIQGETHDWGYLQWLRPLVALMLDGTGSVAAYQCEQLLGARHHRFAPVFPAGITVNLDDAGKVGYLAEFATGLDLAATAAWVRERWTERPSA